ncbi:UDP-glucuronosyltransferase 2B15-like [Gigantopelta aegis]|uniref:UDP-glucuronosyltransferase 2B15-like n=1 Tax=Gigantopelta aegis TaxID=1735272 RepID=UPI001B888DEB|nr:UDP-glucuronosyltransferase 2B15-like [Gigantopelta aegis]
MNIFHENDTSALRHEQHTHMVTKYSFSVPISASNTMQVLILFAVIQMALTAKVLMTFSPMTSHCLEMAAIGNELVKRGHSVSAYVPNFFDTRHCFQNSKIQLVTYDVSETNKGVYQAAIGAIERNVVTREKSIFQALMQAVVAINSICDSQLSNRDQLDQLKEAGYDVAMTEGLPIAYCYYLVPYYMDVPTVSVGSAFVGFDSGEVFQPYTYPHPIGPYTNEMTALQRILNSLHYLILTLMTPILKSPLDLTKYGDPFTNVVPETLFRESMLYLENSDYIADYPKATFPNFVQVGGLTVRPPSLLPNDLKTYFDNSKTGVILVSFGSMLKLESAEFIQRLVSALNQLPYDIILKSNRNSQADNIRIVKWLPQNDVLAHPKIRLFVSHCGKNGFFESLYHSVPIICTPLNADAFQTAIKVNHHRIGTTMDILTATSEEMVQTLKSVLNDSSISSNMRRMSQLFRDRPETGAERGASAIEHVMKYGGRHLKPPTNRLNYFQYTLGELWFVIFSFILLVIYGVLALFRCICCRKSSVSVSFSKKSN